MTAARPSTRRLRILTWHVHGAYLWSLARIPHDLFIPVRSDGMTGFGTLGSRAWPANMREVPAERVRDLELDLVLYQSARNYLEDHHEILSPEQRRLPRVHVEHDPPRGHPTDTRHVVDDPDVLVVHVTHFNRLMWDSGQTPTAVVEHGVPAPLEQWSGELERGITAINQLRLRGRRLGADLFEEARMHVPLDLVGMESEEMGGLGAVSPDDLPALEARYRFYFSPVRYTSLPLAVIEAMHLGMPIVALATTELPHAMVDGVSGFIDVRPEVLIERMRELLADRELAARLGRAAREVARERFGIERFVRDWDEVLRRVTEGRAAG